MHRLRVLSVAAATGLALAVSGCVGESQLPTVPTTGRPPVPSATRAADAAVGTVLRPSQGKGGTLRFGMAGDWDSVDPGNTYDTASWNFLRNYARTLVVIRASPGQTGTTLVPDLATSLGTPSDKNRTWTYTLRDGIRFEDGTPITSKDIKYAVARSLDKSTLPNGPTYWATFLADVPTGYSVYQDKNLDDLTSIDTPDEKTIVFHLKTGFAGFDYLAQLPSTAPVPAAKDTGATYRQNIVSSGPYMFTSYDAGKRYELGRNPNYDPLTDPDSGRAALPNNITVELGLTADDVDARLQNGDLDVDLAGEGVQNSSRVAMLASSTLKAMTDVPSTPSTKMTAINSNVAPLDRLDCRKAVLLAYDKSGYLSASGGTTEGDIASSLLSPAPPGQGQVDLYHAKDKPTGDLEGARAALKRCGRPNGFAMNLAYRSEQPSEQTVAESLQRSLGRVGIAVTVTAYPSSYFNRRYAGNPAYARANRLGLVVYGWRPNWPDGVDFLGQILDSRAVRSSDNSNLAIDGPTGASMIEAATAETNGTQTNAIWPLANRRVMENAGVIPGVWGHPLFYRPSNLTNLFVNPAFAQYDYVAMGTSRR
ncbi:MAG: ABC transporter substrate-binding protein [Humibacillus sp.]|nr:ABC transporter substrate-binding protein [Humibacillus sp.]MDN5777495.1 ABC transporter substrate-binding protein [Humibacillus sp.]